MAVIADPFMCDEVRDRKALEDPDAAFADEPGHLLEKFDPLGTTVSSGVNSLTLSGGVFASWGCGSAAIPAGSSGTEHLRGWEARNVQIIYDYNTTFDFREE